MMKKALVLSAALLLAASGANAATVAAWDFSQFLAPGFMSTDGANPTGQLDANYSDLDLLVVPGLGADSAQFGTLFLDGTSGSSANTFGGPFTNANDLTANNDQANVFGSPMGSGAACNSLLFGEGSQAAFSAPVASRCSAPARRPRSSRPT